MRDRLLLCYPQTWVGKEAPTSVFPDRNDHNPCIKHGNSMIRTLEHSERQQVTDWESEKKDAYGKINKPSSLTVRYVDDSKMGAREKMELEALMKVR